MEGAPPKSGGAKVAPELHVNDLAASLDFWRGILGFEIAYDRPDAYLIMVAQNLGERPISDRSA